MTNNNWLKRVLPIYESEGIEKLANSRVAVLGLGGVGSAAVEAICRSGVGHILIVDNDIVDETNINRQLIATRVNLGKMKTAETAARIKSINPHCDVCVSTEFYLPENSDFVFDFKPDYVIDAIDTVTAKLHLAEKSREMHIPLITCLGTGNRFDPSKLKVGDISETGGCGCPLARVMRRELKKRNINSLKVVFSTEIPFKATVSGGVEGRHSPCSTAFVPPAAGFLIASQVVRDIVFGE